MHTGSVAINTAPPSAGCRTLIDMQKGHLLHTSASWPSLATPGGGLVRAHGQEAAGSCATQMRLWLAHGCIGLALVPALHNQAICSSSKPAIWAASTNAEQPETYQNFMNTEACWRAVSQCPMPSRSTY